MKLTVEKLLKECLIQMEKGNAGKEIVISDDDEGNGYHTLFYGFTDNEEFIKECAENNMFHDNNSPEEVIILG